MNPHPRQLGLSARPGSDRRVTSMDAPQLLNTDRELLYQFPQLLTYPFGFRSLPLANLTVPAGNDAWYGLAEVSPKTFGSQLVWTGYRVELSAMNPDGADDGEFNVGSANAPAAWGYDYGIGAAIVMGINLPCTLGAWTAGPAGVPFVRSSSGPFDPATRDRLVMHFPTGKQNDTPKPSLLRANQTTPLAHPIPDNARVMVALVVNRAWINGITNASGITGRVYGELYFGSPQLTQGLRT